eukprot:UN29437
MLCGCNGWCVLCTLFLIALTPVTINFSTSVWLAMWAEEDEEDRFGDDKDNEWFLSIYAALAVLGTTCAIANQVLLTKSTLDAGRNLHNEAFDGLMEAQMVLFDKMPSGRLLTRFGSDCLQVDNYMVWQFPNTINNISVSFVYIVYSMVLVWYVVFAYIPVIGYVIYLAEYYLRSQ